MFQKIKNSYPLKLQTHPAVITVLLFSILTLSYIGLLCHIFISADSIGYERLGTMIYQQGWAEYLRQGPSREPLYPFLISISMRIGESFSLPYLAVQKCIQIGLLLLTQILMFVILKKLRVPILISAPIVLYLAISSNIVISTFILFSEIATYPIILAIILLSCQSWQNIQAPGSSTRHTLRTIGLGFLLGAFFVLLTSVKAIAQFIPFFFLFPFYVYVIKSLKNKNKNSFIHSMIFLSIFFLTFHTPITLYKFANKKYNGHFTLTNRGPWALYGNTARRMEPLTSKRFLTAMAYVPSEKICKSLLGEDCLFWGQEVSDDFGYRKKSELINSGMNQEQVDKTLYSHAFKKMLQNPLQYIFLAFLEGLKMFFWESTGIAFIVFPGWITATYNFPLFKHGTFFLMPVLTFLALLFSLKLAWRRKKDFFSSPKPPQDSLAPLFFIVMLILPYIGLYSLFFCFARYALPLVPLYLILIALLFQSLLKTKGPIR